MTTKIINDISQIDNSILGFFKELDKEFVPPISQRTTIDNYIKSIFDNEGKLILSLNESGICGILGLATNHPIWKNYIQYIAVSKPYRSKGISTALISKAEEIFFSEGANSITIRTWSSNNISNNVFSHLGFAHTLTVLDERESGVHSHIYMKSLTGFQFKKTIKNLGIIGGMGTYSTATFIDTISNIPRLIAEEQKLISYSLINDPTIPDRTTFILNGKQNIVVDHIDRNIQKLKQLDISHLLVLCFTIHPYLDFHKDKSVEFIDLLNFTLQLLKRKKGRWLLASTSGTYLTKPFSDEKIIYPNEQKQNEIHKIIYKIKSGIDTEYYKQQLIDIAQELNCNGILLGCTDLHKMFGYNFNHNGIEIIDPLIELSLNINTFKQTNETTLA